MAHENVTVPFSVPAFSVPRAFRCHSARTSSRARILIQTERLPLEDVQYLAGHAHPFSTQIYDRRRRRVSRNLVERISV